MVKYDYLRTHPQSTVEFEIIFQELVLNYGYMYIEISRICMRIRVFKIRCNVLVNEGMNLNSRKLQYG